MTVLQHQGITQLSQARVAATIGIRQSHLTYYFPRKSDLIEGLLQQHIDTAAQRLEDMAAGGEKSNIKEALKFLSSDIPRMRFFLSLVLETGQNDVLQDLLNTHIEQFNAMVAHYFNRPPQDADVHAFLNTLRGYGVVNMVTHQSVNASEIEDLALRFGLKSQ